MGSIPNGGTMILSKGTGLVIGTIGTEEALVLWLSEESHIQKVMSLNPGARYWMDIFQIDLL